MIRSGVDEDNVRFVNGNEDDGSKKDGLAKFVVLRSWKEKNGKKTVKRKSGTPLSSVVYSV